MPHINVNLDEVSDSGFEAVPDDKYLVEVQESSKAKISERTGAGYILWIGKIMEGEFEGKMISWMTSLQPQSLWNLKRMLKACKTPEGKNFQWDEDGSFDVEAVAGCTLVVRTEAEEYEGEPRTRVVEYIKA